MQAILRYYTRAKAWIFPTAGWRERLEAYTKGQIQWTVPELPGVIVCPYPSEWCIYEVHEGAIRWPDRSTSDITGRTIYNSDEEREDAVRCCRCGIQMHRLETGIWMENNLSVPVCPWCVPFISRT